MIRTILILVLLIISASAQARKQQATKDEGPDLPYPCFMVRMYAAGKTTAQLEAAGRAHNISPKQRRQAIACLQ